MEQKRFEQIINELDFQKRHGYDKEICKAYVLGALFAEVGLNREQIDKIHKYIYTE